MPRFLLALVLLLSSLLMSCRHDEQLPPPTHTSTVAPHSSEAPRATAVPRRSSAGDEEAPIDGPAGAVRALRAYYAAISAHEYERAWQFWGSSGPPRQTLEQFKEGFRDTASVSVTTAEPSPMGAAAGSRYVEVPVKIVAKMNDDTTQTFEGIYTMRRAVVDGAPATDRAWHIDHATIRRTR